MAWTPARPRASQTYARRRPVARSTCRGAAERQRLSRRTWSPGPVHAAPRAGARPRPRPSASRSRGPDRSRCRGSGEQGAVRPRERAGAAPAGPAARSEEHTSELQSHHDLVCRLLLEKKKKKNELAYKKKQKEIKEKKMEG